MKPAAIVGAKEPTAQAIRLCRAFAMQKFEEAQDNEIFVCGMQPFDADDLMHGVIICRKGMECYHPMEFDYYGAKVAASWFNPKLCAYCAGTNGVDGSIDEKQTLEWRSVLPICTTCRANGALPLVRSRRRNGGAYERRAQRARLENLDATPQEHAPIGVELHVPAASAPRVSHQRR
jgi:hypothetical protein